MINDWTGWCGKRSNAPKPDVRISEYSILEFALTCLRNNNNKPTWTRLWLHKIETIGSTKNKPEKKTNKQKQAKPNVLFLWSISPLVEIYWFSVGVIIYQKKKEEDRAVESKMRQRFGISGKCEPQSLCVWCDVIVRPWNVV